MGGFGVKRPRHAPRPPAQPRVVAAGEEKERQVLIELGEPRAVLLDTEQHRVPLPHGLARARLAELLGARGAREHGGRRIRIFLVHDQRPCVASEAENLTLGGPHRLVPCAGELGDVLVAQAHVDLRVRVDFGGALDRVVARAAGYGRVFLAEKVGTPVVVDEEPVDERVSETTLSADDLREYPVAKHGAVAMVKEVLPTGLGSAVARAGGAIAIGVGLGRGRDFRRLLLVVVEHRALGGVFRRAVRHVVG
mmetsp:Transcript_22294/g.43361  ORF Transcript_22294/g.43361 Transcript_22294/m.43361 type:complete len:251 (-) Transcript_22294:360-1112(-)